MLLLTFILRNTCKVKPNQPMQKDFSGDHATDEEKLASSVGVKPDKDESSE